MNPSSPLVKRFRRFLSVCAVVALVVGGWLALDSKLLPEASARQAGTFKNFESPQVHPLALTPDGTRLLAVNSPNATLSVFQLSSGTPVLTAEIPVGLEPVSVAARNNREAWVVNWLSDTVSVVDLTTGNVVRTLEVGDEPTDVLFAGVAREMAFVCVSGGGRQQIGFSQVTGGSGVVKVFDPNNLAAAPQTLNIPGKQPRSLAKSSNGGQVFVSVFESGNQTTIVPESVVRLNGGLPPPNPAVAPGLPAPPSTSLIVRWNGSAWVDEIGRNWSAHIPYTLADVDLAVIEAAGQSATLGAQVRNVATHVGNMAFDPTQGRLLVANLESDSATRFEPNLRGRFQHSRVSAVRIAPPAVTATFDLNPHVNLAGPGSDQERSQSLALPADIVRASDGNLFVSATSSGRVGVLSSAGVVESRIAVGAGPTGLALDESRARLYVLNRFDQTLSVVDTNSRAEVSQTPVGFNPEPQLVRDGRKLLHDANLSAHGTVSCASCHHSGHRDGLAWDLGNPQGGMDSGQGFQMHPMKGPMLTQSLRGIIGNAPLHWRGDRSDIEAFNPAFTSLLGSPRQLSTSEMAAFREFVRSLTYPPNPNEGNQFNPVNRVSAEFLPGFGFFTVERLFGGMPNGQNCVDCHLVRNFGVGTDNRIISAQELKQTQPVKVPHLRGLYQRTGLLRQPGEQQTGFGFAHDGEFDTLFNFMRDQVFNFSHVDLGTADSWRRDMEQMILRLDTGTAPAVGFQVTVNATNKVEATNRINQLVQQAQAGNCDLVVKGLYFGDSRGFVRQSNGLFQPDSLSEAPVTLQALINAAGTGAELTFTGVPPGTGRQMGIDRDADNLLDDDEPGQSVSITGRVVNAAGQPVANVPVRLSGTQAAEAVTDSLGRFVFNFVSTEGVHTVTPESASLTFSPQNRTFANPSWNSSAVFVTSSGVNASDATQFFVRTHYNDFLNREPDDAGLAFWSGKIDNCTPQPTCRRAERVIVSAAFFFAIEFQDTGFLAYRTYKASFGDVAPTSAPVVPVNFRQLMTDSQRLSRNVVVGVGDWPQQLATNQQAFFSGWVQRPEFVARFPAGMSPADFVNTLNQNAGQVLTPTEISTLTNQLAANNTTAGRAAVVRQVAENAELSRRETRKAFVLMQYFGYLRRNPDEPDFRDLPDPDFNGFNFWLGKLNEHNGNFVTAEMVRAFIESIEYRERFGQ